MYKTPRTVAIGGNGGIRRVVIGGENPVTVQTMWKEGIAGVTDGSNALRSVLERISALQSLGCDIIRFAVPDSESAKALCIIAAHTEVPLVADIHFDYTLALECLKGPVSAIRINPGNIGSIDNVRAVADGCREKNAAIRIGVNSGSLPKDLEAAAVSGKMTRAEALSCAALREAEALESLGFSDIVVSMKSSSVQETVEANEAFARQSDIPLHIGVTEAGPLITGVVKSALAFSSLLKKGIGSTVRVSLSSSPENEVIAGREILHECGLRAGGVSIVSCPRCGRIGFDVHGFVGRWQNRLLSLDRSITVAVMGCVVNGPGEARHADIGIAGGNGRAVIFKKGKIVRTIDEKDADKVFEEELESL